MRNKSEAKIETEPEAPTLKCPNCDNAEASQFEHLEEVTAVRSVRGFDENGSLEIHGHHDCGDDGYNPRFECLECGVEFPGPSDLVIEWV